MLVNFIKKILTKILGFSPDQGEVGFLKNLMWVLGSTFFVAFLMMIIQVIGGRILGPGEYGKYSLVETIANFLAPIALLGIPIGAVYYLAKGKSKKRFYTASLLGILVNLIVILGILFISLNFWSFKFKIDYTIALLGLIFILPTALRTFANAFLRGTGKIKVLALTESISGFLGFLFFLLLIFLFHLKNFQLIFYSKTLYFSLVFLISLVISLPFIAKTSAQYLKKLYSYSNYIFLAQISGTIIIFIDRFFVNYLLGTYSVGLYQAYYFSAQAILFQAMQAFLLVFFPLMAGAKDKKIIVEKIEKVFFRIIPAILLFDMISILFFLWLFGRQYSVNFIWVFFLGLQMTAYVIYQFYSNALSATDKFGAKINAQYLICGAVIFSGVSFPLVKFFGIAGTIFGRFLIYFILLLIYRFYIKKRLNNENSLSLRS